MLDRLREQIPIVLAHIEALLGPGPELAPPPPPQPQPRQRELRPSPAMEMAGAAENAAITAAAPDGDWGKIPRNAPCPCGSGKKFKYCHGRV